VRLRTKLLALSITLIVVVIIAFSSLILTFLQNDLLNDVVENGLEDYKHFSSSLVNKTLSGTPEQPTILRSYLISQFRSISGFSEFTLRVGEEFLINNTGFAPESLFESGDRYKTSDDGQCQYRTARVSGVEYLVVQSNAKIGTEEYSIALVRNISEMVNGIQQMAMQCGITGICVIVVAATAMWLIVFRSMKPIKTLKSGAAQLAQGQYENRIVVAGKDELSELAADFNKMADAIELNIHELNDKAERQQVFINDLSHELKTPVTSIMLCAETLLSRKVSQENQTSCLQRIYEQGKWLERLSQKLMALVLLQSKISKRPESVGGLLEAVKATTIDALMEKDIKLVIDCDSSELEMDFDLMRSALVNLIENARKASDEGQNIEIHARENIIEVTDHGKGIPPEEIERITDPFYMVDRSRSKAAGGSGLGLTIVKKIVEAHGAALSIKSAPGKGTVMRITFEWQK